MRHVLWILNIRDACFATFKCNGCHNDWNASAMSEIQLPAVQKYFPLLQRPDKL